ncbi:tRNA(Ile)(2)-agmatinylcytidine synthase [Halapricum hydrolyticum]|uniref:tRNA(Ile2) 2-agmatinylcytidine synthetase TiaS n=1 Tax=Halapricum hydrolyticum TaxID=2979991 RepID=A0AAE3I9K9_9EURY|nr:tRNA(Ile)(2)-agmatinylcytidine synthase [Halapricum hydrolyticum]MCU4718424.1 tRNA(Ile)(2)-agmatinylcytidine synthase [Halapricum hydrolyticum]MCU4726463.1 tRNA(Ile)(2)-agmatinylcytidine synthase [Halapricum hydrolyticum]
MTVVGLDDTDSRERGMCTTYVAARLAERLRSAGQDVDRTLLVRLNPAVEYKTRGNAALAIHIDADPERVHAAVHEEIGLAETADPQTNPGVVIADGQPGEIPDDVAEFAREAIRTHHDIDDARELADRHGFVTLSRGNGRGLIGALAAVGAWRAFEEWTYESISYRERERWGTDREVDRESVFAAAEDAYPDAWDTVDRVEGQAVCVPHTPCPILYGIRGDDPDAVEAVADRIESEPVARRQLFVTNQGTDAHLEPAAIGETTDGRAYCVDGTVVDPPETRPGGHVFLSIGDGEHTLDCAAFEPTKRFRDRVRALRVGDALTVCGEVSDGTLKLEKFAVRDLRETEPATPDCPECGRSMESAGRGQGYRCRDCGTSADGKVEQEIDRDLEVGWYEVPPVARRHIAKPLIRGGFDGPIHPER